jgi:predicted HicB family RNase H-like nuclease
MTQAKRHQLEINLGPVLEALERPLNLIDSPERRADIQRYLEAGRIHLERGMVDVLSAAVGIVNDAGAGARARLEYQAGKLYLVVESAEEAEPSDPEPIFEIDGEMEKVTIRLPAELKELISEAANLRGVSINSWYIRELARTVSRQVREQVKEERRESRREQRGQRRGRSLRGFIGD